jgi:CRP-like cAMP-binding protein
MSLTVERVLLLKSADVFSEVPEEDLLELAAGVEEIEARLGERIIEKGELGSSLYIVVDGSVRVHDGDRELRVLGCREIFGELSVLDPQPRSASVTAVEDTLLFRLDERVLYEMMTENQALTRGIIQMLCRRLRKPIGDD